MDIPMTKKISNQIPMQNVLFCYINKRSIVVYNERFVLFQVSWECNVDDDDMSNNEDFIENNNTLCQMVFYFVWTY